ncbi:hypothetical protein AcW1_001568 [Taiwanofungus camphoratus]|nr:hypothetical protein AcW1_001568 [Antrodia cinnamomea]
MPISVLDSRSYKGYCSEDTSLLVALQSSSVCCGSSPQDQLRPKQLQGYKFCTLAMIRVRSKCEWDSHYSSTIISG